MFTKFDKFLVGLVGFAAVVAETQYSTSHWTQVVVSLATALGVWAVPNKTD